MEKITDRIHIVLPPTLLMDLDDYRFVARKNSRSDAIRCLVRLALREDGLPQSHLDTLDRMRAEKSRRSPEEQLALIDKYQHENARIHILLESEHRRDIEAYRTIAELKTRAAVIKYLAHLSLKGELPRKHRDIVARLVGPDKPIRDLAHQFWEQEGRPSGKDQEHWERAKAALAAAHGEADADAADREVSRPRNAASAEFDVLCDVPYVPVPTRPDPDPEEDGSRADKKAPSPS
ncbi:MAG TPA: DUF2934 domain-containing protein [Xanthobacteraceae bacterium]|nr:DUF2934 domain-containing protein [Xanthobacteraceae bacterium]